MDRATVRMIVGAALAFAGCATSRGMQDNVRKRATFDLNCPADKIQVIEIEPPANTSMGALGTWGARGCGRQATYVQERYTTSSVVMNSPVAPDTSSTQK